jgi:hypothetical protein
VHPSVAFNSGIEITIRNWLSGDAFNMLKYDQHPKEDGSLIISNTNSTLIMLALSGGKGFFWS